MFVITADQRGSRSGADLVPQGLAAVSTAAGDRLALAPERTAGDELQAALPDPDAVLEVILELTRSGTWSVGVGLGAVDEPMPAQVRAARGPAFVNARDAVERAKRATTRVAISGGDEAADSEALVRLLVELRDRRTAEGWEVHDLLARGLAQKEAAARLGISEAAVSLRVRSAGLRTEEAAIPALRRALRRADAAAVRSSSHPADRAEPVRD